MGGVSDARIWNVLMKSGPGGQGAIKAIRSAAESMFEGAALEVTVCSLEQRSKGRLGGRSSLILSLLALHFNLAVGFFPRVRGFLGNKPRRCRAGDGIPHAADRDRPASFRGTSAGTSHQERPEWIDACGTSAACGMRLPA